MSVRFASFLALCAAPTAALHSTLGSAPRVHRPRSRPPLAVASSGGDRRSALLGFSAALAGSLSLAAPASAAATPWPYSTLIEEIDRRGVQSVLLSADGKQVVAIDKKGERHEASVIDSNDLLGRMRSAGVQFEVLDGSPGDPNPLLDVALGVLPPLLLLGGLFFLSRNAGAGGPGGLGGDGGPMGFGKSKSEINLEPQTGVTFDDVAGCDGSKLELTEVVDFLKNPAKYAQLGAKVPRGVLMEGPPGTGKTLLARAVAGEAGVPFVSCSGSEFVEMFVGVGASRVRDLFAKAKKNAPCIVFIDEIDAVGRARPGGTGGGPGGGNDEREQTLNQILTEMDGFEGNSGVIVISATNRGDILDPALLRPGRFDRRVPVDLPDKPGREQILKVHARGKPLDADVTLGEIAARTTGFSGASLENLLNEAAIMAARRNRTSISYSEVDFAIDRIQVGLVKTGGGQSFPARQRLVAYHEAGHAVMGLLTPDYDTVTKVTIIPRSNGAGGFTLFTPSDEQLESGLYSKRYLEGQLAVALGGRVAEEIVYGEDEVTTGASSDLQQVRNIARRMVAQWGFTADDEVTADMLVGWEAPDAGRFTARTASGETEARIDLEVRRICDKAYENCYATLAKHRGLMDELTDQLIDKETINARELLEMLEKYDPKLFKELGKEAPPDLVPVPAA